MKFFLIGIKGSGMAALASLLDDEGYSVSGSDVWHKCLTDDKLLTRGIHLFKLNDKEYLKYDVVIIGHDFYKEELIKELEDNNKIFFEYHEFLDFYLNKEKLISICGSHGKTTLVNLLSLLEPSSSYLRGDGEGRMKEFYDFFFLESCEYKRHFLMYHPKEIIITNIDFDHVDYFKNEKDYKAAFNEFVENTSKIFINYKDRKKVEHGKKITFGKNKKATYHYHIFHKKQDKIYVTFYREREYILDLEIKDYGNNFLSLITGCIAFLNEHNIDLSKIEKRLKKYRPASQRFEEININGNMVILDYAHHPKQILNNYQIVSKKYKELTKIAIFRGDRFSRISYFKKEIKRALEKYDYAYILPLPNMVENTNKNSKILSSKKIEYIENIEQIEKVFLDNKKYSISLMSSKPFNHEIEYLKSKF